MQKTALALLFALGFFMFPAPAFAIIPIFPPTLTISPESGYADDPVSPGVHPNIGTMSASVFTFKVVYVQSQNRAPMSLDLVVGNGTATTTHAMTRDVAATDPSLIDGNYANGEQYIYSTTFPPGTWSYRVESDFGVQLPATGDWMFSANADPGCTIDCNSNVLFLPGLEASRLYEPRPCDLDGCTTQLWEPAGDVLVRRLFLTNDGTSTNDGVRTSDVVDEAFGFGPNIYETFIATMNNLRSSGTIHDWAATPYDWRFSPEEILQRGVPVQDGISYLTPTSSPYILNELHRLAASSRTGRVTIIAHSYGGIIAKELLRQLGDEEAVRLVDKLILIASPQMGTPQAIGGLLHGFGQGIPSKMPFFLHESTAREFGENMPGAYELLPSARYFDDVATPVARFANSSPVVVHAYERYGGLLNGPTELHDFLLGKEGRIKPSENDTLTPNVLNEMLLQHAEMSHATLDQWMPPSGIEITQIAGWGIDTLASLTYSQKKKGDAYLWQFHPDLVEDGDGTVVVPSALAMSVSAGNVVNWWVNLSEYNDENIDRDHANILEVEGIRGLVRNILTNSSENLPTYISVTPPQPTGNQEKKLRFFLHSPLSLNIYDDQGHHTGVSTTTGMVDSQIPGAYYREFGEVKYITAPAGTTLHLILNGEAAGFFDLEIEEVGGSAIVATTTFIDIPSSTSTVVTMNFTDGTIANAGALNVDEDGNGTTDFSLTPKLNDIVTPPTDTTAPEVVIAFSTSTKAILIFGVDDSGIAIMSSTTTYPTLKKGQKRYNGIATTTVTIRDGAGNSTRLTYTEKLPSPLRRDIIQLVSISYNGATSSIPAILRYKWNTKQNGDYRLFATYFATSTMVIESHYRPKKNITVIMQKPVADNDRDTDDDADTRPVKIKMPGMVVPTLRTQVGKMLINY